MRSERNTLRLLSNANAQTLTKILPWVQLNLYPWVQLNVQVKLYPCVQNNAHTPFSFPVDVELLGPKPCKNCESRMSEANPRQSLVKGERLIRYELASAILEG